MAAVAPGTGPVTTLIPFAQLPSCAAQCGKLFDVNGACVPPGAPTADETTYTNCFCNDPRLAPFRTGAADVCGAGVCQNPGEDTAGVTSIQNWFATFCGIPEAAVTPAGGSGGQSGGSNGAKSGSSSSGGGGDWLSGHWKYVVMLVFMVVGIAGIWIGACIWRRRYLRRKDRAYELGKHVVNRSSGPAASWGPGAAPPNLNAGPGIFMSPANGNGTVYEEKNKPKETRRWLTKSGHDQT